MANDIEVGAWGSAMRRDASEARACALADGIWRLRLPLVYQQVRAVNAYLLERDDGYSDHYGLAATIVERTGCELWTAQGPPAAADALRDPVIPAAQRRERVRRAGVPDAEMDDLTGTLDGGDGLHARPQPARRLSSGDRVEAAPGTWHLLAAPGHARNQIVLHGPAIGWMISADLAIAGVSPYLEHGYGGDPVIEHLGSVRAALAAAPTRLLPGHGPPIEDARVRVIGDDGVHRFASRTSTA